MRLLERGLAIAWLRSHGLLAASEWTDPKFSETL
jgi:hypothetical protein